MKYFAAAPSPFIDMPNTDAAHRLFMSILQLGAQCADAEEAVEMFEESRQLERRQTAAQRERRRAQAQAPSGEHAVELFEEMRQLARGDAPDPLKQTRRAQMHARSLVFAVDNFVKMLGSMASDVSAPGAVLRTVIEDFVALVPGAKALRDSLHHIEDRARGLNKKGKPIVTTDVSYGPVRTSGPSIYFVGSNLVNNRIMCTADNGDLVDLEVSEVTVQTMVETLQKVINAFTWKPSPSPMQIP